MCYTEGELLAYLDEQLAPRQMAPVKAHLSRCRACRSRLRRLQEEQDQVAALLDPYQAATAGSIQKRAESRYPEGIFPDQQLAETKGAMTIVKRYQGLIAAAAAVIILAGIFSFGPARSFAAQVLTIFRVNRVQVLHFDPADVQQLQNALRANGQKVDLDSFGTFNHEQLQDSSLIDANTVAINGQQITIPEAIGGYKRAGDLQLTQGERLLSTPKVAGINSFLTSLGSKSLLPDSLDGKTFTVQMSGAVAETFEQAGSASPLVLRRSLSPALTVPPGVDLEQVRKALLAVPILPESMRSTLAGVDIYGSTLMIPDFGIDNRGGSIQEVDVNGSQGVLFTPPQNSNTLHKQPGEQLPGHPLDGKVLMWPQGTVWNALEGNFSLDQAVALAADIK